MNRFSSVATDRYVLKLVFDVENLNVYIKVTKELDYLFTGMTNWGNEYGHEIDM